MTRSTHSARVTGPVVYVTTSGKQLKIPLGPCLVEHGEGTVVDVVWGASGQNSATLPRADFERAAASGHLLVLDQAHLT